MKRDFLRSLGEGAALAVIFGAIGGAVIGGIAAIFTSAIALPAAIGAGVFGVLLGGGCAGVNAGTKSDRDWRAGWISSIPVSLLLSAAAYHVLPDGKTGLANTQKPTAPFNKVSPLSTAARSKTMSDTKDMPMPLIKGPKQI